MTESPAQTDPYFARLDVLFRALIECIVGVVVLRTYEHHRDSQGRACVPRSVAQLPVYLMIHVADRAESVELFGHHWSASQSHWSAS